MIVREILVFSAMMPDDVVDGPTGVMMHVHEETAKGDKYREMPLLLNLATTRTVDDVHEEVSNTPFVDISTQILRRWAAA